MNPLGDKGALALSTWLQEKGCSSLQVLILKDCQIGPLGAHALIQALPPCIETIVLEDNPIGSKGCEALVECLKKHNHSLKSVTIRNVDERVALYTGLNRLAGRANWPPPYNFWPRILSRLENPSQIYSTLRSNAETLAAGQDMQYQ